jgi:NADPH-dependent 2,4-dienoyl-CoA reductase/sulfur reductase-like enzyme
MEAISRKLILKRLEALPVQIHTGMRLLRIEKGEAFVAKLGQPTELSLGRFDSVLVAVGHQPHDPLSDELRSRGVDVVVIGDAVRPGQILDATRSARAALETPSKVVDIVA